MIALIFYYNKINQMNILQIYRKKLIFVEINSNLLKNNNIYNYMKMHKDELEIDYSKFDERFQNTPEPIPEILSEKEKL